MWDYFFVCYWLLQIWQELLEFKKWPLRILSDSVKHGSFVEFCQAAILNCPVVCALWTLKVLTAVFLNGAVWENDDPYVLCFF